MTFQVNGDSKEAVAFGLMQCILHADGRGNSEHPFPADSSLLRGRKACGGNEMLMLYARCLRVVQGADPGENMGAPPPEADQTPASLHS
ncbi:MAG TPA: hypothetical protein VMU82_06035 [Acetobacteraceae bacterium]|nr:hypothetical protein [Acetobacteraceae bacterium]